MQGVLCTAAEINPSSATIAELEMASLSDFGVAFEEEDFITGEEFLTP